MNEKEIEGIGGPDLKYQKNIFYKLINDMVFFV